MKTCLELTNFTFWTLFEGILNSCEMLVGQGLDVNSQGAEDTWANLHNGGYLIAATHSQEVTVSSQS